MEDVVTAAASLPAAAALLRELVSVQSGSANVPGVNAVQDIVSRELVGLGFGVTRVAAGPAYGDHVVGRRPGRPGSPRVVLDGHVDTVFPAGSDTGYRETPDGRAFGQGVVDMKGGVVTALRAVRVLVALGLADDLDLTFLSVSDEEVGGPSSRPVIATLAADADLALCFEEAGKSLEIVTGRRGTSELVVTSAGKAGHSGNVLTDRRSAVEELCHKVVGLRNLGLGRAAEGFLLNVGVVSGGTAANVIADHAFCRVNVRYETSASFSRFLADAGALVSVPDVPGTRTWIAADPASMPPMEPSPGTLAAFGAFRAACRALGHDLREERRGGASDANLWSDAGVPVLDGLGPIGGDDHSADEWVDLASLDARVVQTAVFLGGLRPAGAAAGTGAERGGVMWCGRGENNKITERAADGRAVADDADSRGER